jgi:YidC/Oxa1 family membrane protein insertase
MERSSIVKLLFFAIAAFLFIQYGMPLITGKGSNERQPLAGIVDDTAPPQRAAEAMCAIEGNRFTAELSTRGASLVHFVLTDPRYATDGRANDLATFHSRKDPRMSLTEARRPLRTDLRVPGQAAQQVAYDDLDWKIESRTPKRCTFKYEDKTARLVKIVEATDKPFELSVSLEVENLSDKPLKHRLSVEQSSFRTNKEMEGHLGRQSEFLSETVLATESSVERHTQSDFTPSDFKKPEFTPEKWRRVPGKAKLVGVSSVYFANAVAPVEGPAPFAEDQVEERWDHHRYPDRDKDEEHGWVFRSRLLYPEAELAPNATAKYKVISFMGPKERDILASAGHDFSEVLNLGWFTPIAKVLVSYLYWLYGFVKSWGWAICLLTITVRTALFPLSIAQIKNTVAMRKLKPEMDAINEKYKDDMTQRGLATQELFRRNNMSQFSFVTGCLPMLLQMPVWWALYTALQTAVELYHTPFAWFADLSAPDKFFIIPVVLGASSFLQQKMMPPQGDPQQQKMMLYMMPGIFTVMMLFLPSGLGVYMLTNTWLGIGQQFLVERYLRRKTEGSGGGGIEVKDKTPGDSVKRAPLLGKGKARVSG